MQIAAQARNSAFVAGVKDKTTQLTCNLECPSWPSSAPVPLESAICPFSTSVGRNTYVESSRAFQRT